MQNKSTEDYLKHIFWLSKLKAKITTKSVAGRMGISSASVTDMIKKLTKNGFLEYTPYHGVRLTDRGEKLALQVIRRHRLLELFLVKALGYGWDKVHEEAERLEHVISDEMESRMDRFLGYPKYDPHGDPIPTHEGFLEEPAHQKLSDLSAGEHAVITQVKDSETLLQYMGRLKLALNSRVTVKKKESFDDTIVLTVEGNENKQHHLSREATDHIFVKRIKNKK